MMHSVRFLLAALLAAPMLVPSSVVASAAPADLTAEFFRLCDLAAPELLTAGRDTPFYAEAYAVRALCVAHDVSQKAIYRESTRAWAERMIDFQRQMIPAGAYYMNYGRKPGAGSGSWNVADSASIAMGVLAVAVRAEEPAARSRYLGSVRAFADLVLANWIGPHGGVRNGHWAAFQDEWWCSTSNFGSLLFLLQQETPAPRDLQVALAAIDWLNRLDLMTAGPMTIAEKGATIPFYILEAYSAAWPHLPPGSERQRRAMAQLDRALAWADGHRAGAKGSPAFDYTTLPGLKVGGLPFHLLVAARTFPERAALVTAADEEFRYIAHLLATHPNPSRPHIAPIHLRSMPQMAIFTMFSLAERVAPGAVYRTSPPGPARR